MRTGALVLAILGNVFGGLGMLAALILGASLMSLSGGAEGTGAAGGAALALLAVVIGIVGTTLMTRRPRLAAGLCASAAVLGLVGTLAFGLASLLYLIGGALALFTPTDTTARLSDTTVVTRATEPRGRFRLSRVVTTLIAAAVVLSGGVFALVAAQPAEHRPVKTLLAAVQKSDDVALAAVLAPSLRAGRASPDADAVLHYALQGSEISFLDADWLRRLGPLTGTIIAFENLSITTTSKLDDSAVVHVRGLFVATNPDPLINLLVQGVRQAFDADIALTRVMGEWYVAAPAALQPTPAVTHTDRAAVAHITASAAPTPTPTRHLALGTYATPGSVTLSEGGWRMTLRDVTVNVDESVLYEFDLVVGPTDGSWAARESRLELSSGQWLNVLPRASTFYDGGKGPGAAVRVALAFPPGLAGNQPYVIRVCGNLGFCWPPLPGPSLGER